jgi:hypothetical protein
MLLTMAPPKKKPSVPATKSPSPAPETQIPVPAKPSPYDQYLQQLSAMPIKGEALNGTGLTAQDIRDRAEIDPDFSRKLAQAWDVGIDVAEDAAFRRGIVGWEEPVFTKDGGMAGYVTRYDGGLLKEVLKANRAKYRGEDVGRSRGVSEETRREVNRVFEEAGGLL